MKALIGAACAAIIAASGTYLFGQYQDWRAEAAQARYAKSVERKEHCDKVFLDRWRTERGLPTISGDTALVVDLLYKSCVKDFGAPLSGAPST